jgi:hypothetical protein
MKQRDLRNVPHDVEVRGRFADLFRIAVLGSRQSPAMQEFL